MSTRDDDRRLAERLRDLRVESEDDGFGAALHRKLAAAGPPEPAGLWERLRPVRARLLWPALGLAAGVVAFAVLGLRQVPPGQPEIVSHVPGSQVAVVRLNLSSDVAVHDADIRVTLPEGLVFWSEGEALAQRSFEWSQPLAAGDNIIPIAVRGERPGRYRMQVLARMGAEQVRHDVVLEVSGG